MERPSAEEDSLILRIDGWLGTKSMTAIVVASSVLLLALALLQYLTGVKTTVAPFYLIPISAVTLRGGRPTGLLFSIAAGAIFLLLELPYPLNRYIWLELWNDLLRIGLFVACALALARLKADILREMKLKAHLQEALAGVKQLSGLLPICAWCKRIRDKQGNWELIEEYVTVHSHADFTQDICPDCARRHPEGAPPVSV